MKSEFVPPSKNYFFLIRIVSFCQLFFGFSVNCSAITSSDSLYLRSIQKKSSYWEDRDLDSSNYYSRFQLTEALRLNCHHFISTAYNQLGCNANITGKPDSAYYFFSKAEEFAKPFGIRGAYPSIVYNRAQLYRVTNQLDKAIEDLKQVLQFDLDRHDYHLMAGTLNELGNCVKANGQTVEGIKYYMMAYQVAAYFIDTVMLGGLSINMASEFLNLKLDKEARQMALNSLYWFSLSHNDRGMSFANNLLAQIQNNKLDLSLKYRKKALLYGLKSNDKSHLATIYEGLGFHYYSIKQLDSAMYFQNLAIENRRFNGEARLLSSSYFNLASIYFEKGLFKDASRNLDSLYLLPQQGNVEHLYLARRLHARIDSASGNYKSAYENSLAALQHHEQYFSDDTKTELLRLKTANDNEKKEWELKNDFLRKEIALNSKLFEQKKQRNILYTSLGFLVIVFSGLYIHKVRKQRERELRLKLKLFESEMDGLESQINTHFIYNTLAVIQRYIYENKAEQAISCLNRFAKLLRISLIHCRNGLVSLDAEMEAIRLYTELISLNFDKSPDCIFEVSTEIELSSIKIPPMLVQPLVENAFKHGVSGKPGNGKVWIHLCKKGENLLKITIRDNGPELSSNSSQPGLSLSTSIITDRLELLNKQYKTTQFTLNLAAEPYLSQNTTVAEIILPIAA